MDEKVKIQIWVRTGYVGSIREHEFEVDKHEWKGMTEDEKNDMCFEEMLELIEWGYITSYIDEK